MKAKIFLRMVWKWTKRIFIFLFFFHLFCILLFKWADPPITMTQLVSWVSGDGLKRDYVGWKKISYNAKLSVIASEDQVFPDHNGFDWKSIKKAMAYNKRKPNRIHGASTISQQVAKNVFLWQGRGWIRKGLEAYFTFMIELIWGKKRTGRIPNKSGSSNNRILFAKSKKLYCQTIIKLCSKQKTNSTSTNE